MQIWKSLACVVLGALAACGGGTGATPPSSGVVELLIADPVVFVGSYHPIEVRIDAASGLTVEDLTFAIPAGPVAGDVSLSKERAAPAKPLVMLLAGPRPGDYELVASETATGTELAHMAFTTTTRWADDDNGPSVWFTGTPTGTPGGGGWGGGPGTPQNFNIAPALGTRRIAIVLVDSASQRYTPAEAAATRTQYMDHAVNGVTTGGVTRSTARFYNEVSYGNLNITAVAFGPYSLSGLFGEYIASGAPNREYYQACLTAADADINYEDFDNVVCVLRTDETTDPARPVGAWAYAGPGSWGPYTTNEGDRNLGMISMSSTWDSPGRRVFETLCHELGHNLGMGDMYSPEVPRPPPSTGSRNLAAWGMMHLDAEFPHFAAAHRMRLGWIDRSWIRNIDFSRAAGPVDEDLDLEAIERGAPTAAPYNVLEIRIADGWNYYFEYRKAQAGQIGDQNLPQSGSVLGTDAVVGVFPIARPFLLLLNDDVDGDGSVLQAGEDYQETDFDPLFPSEFRIDVTDIVDDVASVRVRYGVHGKPDPSIRPWPAGPDRPYQSPDIEVRNARNAADPELFNLPWAENPNTVVARITNRGNLNAQDVVANFYVKGLTVGGAAEVFLGSDTHTIGPSGTEEFKVPWTPPREEHFCIVVRIPLYVTPVGSIVELTERNNIAQSNYARFISARASPASREGTFVIVGNPYPLRTRVMLVCSQTNAYYRTYVEHRWLRLDPLELRRVRVMFEHAGKLPDLGGEGQGGATGKPDEHNTVIIRAFVEDPRVAQVETAVPYDGIQIRVDTGRATQIDVTGDKAGVVSGTVRTIDDNEEVAGGQVIVSYEDPKSAGRVGHQLMPVVSGMFATEVPDDWTAIHATYLPAAGLAESDASTTR